ncbi:hypothetical protein ACJ73_09641 [Blastomyces percursus]|uniref:Uncharacterized protein n=1 Tax=Blastomyces percursus TaxID=1658174 RepID=A0A1J9Q401_9EURO|nr:hypothetical protein ACJ73_09641 [Blastomyces percursus]
MGALEEMLEVRPHVLERLAKTRVIGRHLDRIFDETTDLKQSVLTTQLEELGIKVSSFDLEGSSEDDDSMTFYRPLPKEQFPVINWDEANFSNWSEGYSEESRRVDLTLGNVSHELWRAFWDDMQHPWVRNRQVVNPQYKCLCKGH